MKRARQILATLILTVPALCAGRALAAPETHDAFFLRLGANVGPALVTITPDAGADPDVDVVAFQAGIDALFGGSPVPGLVIGGGPYFTHAPAPSLSAEGADVTYDGTMISYGTIVFATYYFDPTLGLNLQGHFGYGALDFLSDDFDKSYLGPNVGVGVGYEFWLGPEWSVGPFARFTYAALGADDGSASYVYPTLGGTLTYH